MNALSIDLTAIMQSEGITRIERRIPSGLFVVRLEDGRAGSGGSVALALKCAKGPNAVRLAS